MGERSDRGLSHLNWIHQLEHGVVERGLIWLGLAPQTKLRNVSFEDRKTTSQIKRKKGIWSSGFGRALNEGRSVRSVVRRGASPLLTLAESGRLPDWAVKIGVNLRLRAKVRNEGRGGPAAISERKQQLLTARAAGPLTTHVAEANRQHYEVPSSFFSVILGPARRYSCCFWPSGVSELEVAERAALEQTVERARLSDGDRILELGSGWGSLALFMAARFPSSEIVTVSNSGSQKSFIDEQAQLRGLTNLVVHTADVDVFEPLGRFDRVVSVEMFEHVRNHRELLRRVGTWLQPKGTCFIHVFSHKALAWHFDADAENDWLARYFFAGGTMPSDDLLLHEQNDLAVVEHWWLDGRHYAKTLQAWLDRLDANPATCLSALAEGDDPTPVDLQLSRWRLFLLASIGTWGLDRGRQFGVSHYLFTNRSTGRTGHKIRPGAGPEEV